jgi:coenzyme F420-reducing hydrogenase gamma subunit
MNQQLLNYIKRIHEAIDLPQKWHDLIKAEIMNDKKINEISYYLEEQAVFMVDDLRSIKEIREK